MPGLEGMLDRDKNRRHWPQRRPLQIQAAEQLAARLSRPHPGFCDSVPIAPESLAAKVIVSACLAGGVFVSREPNVRRAPNRPPGRMLELLLLRHPRSSELASEHVQPAADLAMECRRRLRAAPR